MLKRKLLLCSLVLLITAFSGVASATAPYASIIGFMSNGGQFQMNTLGTLDIINMTPWHISVGNVQAAPNTPILSGMTATPLVPFWVAGFNGATWKSGQGNANKFAFHSWQIQLANLNAVWKLDNKLNIGFNADTYASNPVQIVFNSQTGVQSGNTVALNFTATSSNGFSVAYGFAGSQTYPATAISFGDGANNYGWETFYSQAADNKSPIPQHYLTIQALQGGANWQPITPNLVNTPVNPGKDGAAPGTPVKGPQFLTSSGLVYPNFSTTAGDGGNYDLVVILQAGNYTDMQLLFLAVPYSNDGFLRGMSF